MGIQSGQWSEQHFVQIAIACRHKTALASLCFLLLLLLLSPPGFCSELPGLPWVNLPLCYFCFFMLLIPSAGSVKTWTCWPLEQMPQISLALLSDFNGDELPVVISWISQLGCRETINLKATNIPKSYALKSIGAPGSSALLGNRPLN